MNRKLLLLIVFVFFTRELFSQNFYISKKKLVPTTIDTARENIFIFELEQCSLFFSQDEILKFLKDAKNKSILGSTSYKRLEDTLRTGAKVIKVKDIPDYKNKQEFDSLLRIYSNATALQELNSQFYVIGAALILKGSFMLYSNIENRFVNKGLFVKSRDGLLGKRSLNFYMPKKQRFYYIITRPGDK